MSVLIWQQVWTACCQSESLASLCLCSPFPSVSNWQAVHKEPAKRREHIYRLCIRKEADFSLRYPCTRKSSRQIIQPLLRLCISLRGSSGRTSSVAGERQGRVCQSEWNEKCNQGKKKKKRQSAISPSLYDNESDFTSAYFQQQIVIHADKSPRHF